MAFRLTYALVVVFKSHLTENKQNLATRAAVNEKETGEGI